MYYQHVYISEKTLKAIADDPWLPEFDRNQAIQALASIDLQRTYDNTPSGLTPWGQPMSEFRKIIGQK